MSNWNCSSPEERIKKWKDFRDENKGLPRQKLINNVAEFFADMPTGARALDFYDPDTWPTPWEILYHKLYCQNTVSLLIYHTLHILLEDPADLKIILIDDTRNRFLVPILEDKYIFNYVLGMISNIHDYKEIIIVDDFEDQIVHNVF